MQLKPVLLTLSVLTTTILSGCSSSMFAIGEEEFSCPGREKGVICAGPRQVYEMTNTRDDLSSEMMRPDGTPMNGGSNRGDLTNKTGKSDDWLIANFNRIEADAIDDPDDDTIELYKAAVQAKLKSISNTNSGDSFNEQTIYKERGLDRQHPDRYDKAEVIAGIVSEHPAQN